jgi:tRNA(adenine34) deaminase
MRKALNFAAQMSGDDDIPVAALVANARGEIIAMASNTSEKHCDPTAHAEVLAIRSASKSLAESKLRGCVLVTTLEPCIMCAGAILGAQIDTVIFGAFNSKFGAAGSKWDILRDPLASHHPEVIGGILESECSVLLKEFFTRLRLKSGITTDEFVID